MKKNINFIVINLKLFVFTLFFFSICSCILYTQNGIQYDVTKLYRFHMPFVNPAAFNFNYIEDHYRQHLMVSISRRNQWYNLNNQMDGEPIINNLRFEYYNNDLELKTGIFYHQYQVGPHQNNYRALFNFAKTFILDAKDNLKSLSIGFNVGIEGFQLRGLDDINWIGEDWSNYFLENTFKRNYLDVAFGIFYFHDFQESAPKCGLFDTLKRYYFGISFPKSNLHNIIIGQNNTGVVLDKDINNLQPIYLLGGMNNGLNSDATLTCETTIWLRWLFGDQVINEGLPNSVDLNFKFQYYDDFKFVDYGFWLGLGGGFYQDRRSKNIPHSDVLFRGTKNLQFEIGGIKGIKGGIGSPNKLVNNYFLSFGAGIDISLDELSGFGPSLEATLILSKSL